MSQFLCTTSETEVDYYHQKVNVRVASQVAERNKTRLKCFVQDCRKRCQISKLFTKFSKFLPKFFQALITKVLLYLLFILAPSFNRMVKWICAVKTNFFPKTEQLTHYSPVLLFYNPWKHHKTYRFSDIFRGYR